jgi:hypothetical protein
MGERRKGHGMGIDEWLRINKENTRKSVLNGVSLATEAKICWQTPLPSSPLTTSSMHLLHKHRQQRQLTLAPVKPLMRQVQ